jgi:hypothetical protein
MHIRRGEKQYQIRGEVIDLPERNLVQHMRQHFDKAMNLTNETDEEVQHDEQEMEDNATEEGESLEDELDPEDGSHGAFRNSLITS